MDNDNSRKTVLVGQGLEKRTYEDCLQQRLNPNGNAAGAIHLPTDEAAIIAHIERSQARALRALQ